MIADKELREEIKNGQDAPPGMPILVYVDGIERRVANEDDARKLLESYHGLEDDGDDYLRVGPYTGFSYGSYGFICWRYSDEYPLEEDYAFHYSVNKDTGALGAEGPPLGPGKAKMLYKEYFREC